MRILVIEDDQETADHIVSRLAAMDNDVDHRADGRDGVALAGSRTYDAAIIDRMLPELDGIGCVKALRAAGIDTPVLFLTALDGIDDRVEGLNAGGDDYLIKPFAISELWARVNALVRRAQTDSARSRLCVADLEIDVIQRSVVRDGRSIDLAPREFLLLEYLMRNAGRTVTRTMLLENVWDFHFDPRTNIVETHISRLRSKVDRGCRTPLIRTVRGAGYMLRAHA